jgi:short-subunit dehydrogenase
MDRILIIGASGGLGEALARHYAPAGSTLLLWGRDRARLQFVADACRQLGAQVTTRSLDLSDVGAAVDAIREDDAASPIGLALLAAGLGDIRSPDQIVEDPAQVERLGLINFVAPSAIATALTERMASRRRGRIVLIGSAAAFHALPFAASYAASKAGLAHFAHALRTDVARHGVCVTLVSPGFIDTLAGSKTPGPKLFLMQPADVASRIAKAAKRGQAHLILPWPFAGLRLLDHLLPRPLRDRLLVAITPRTEER